MIGKSLYAILCFTAFLFGSAFGYWVGVNPHSYHFETISPICHQMEHRRGDDDYL